MPRTPLCFLQIRPLGPEARKVPLLPWPKWLHHIDRSQPMITHGHLMIWNEQKKLKVVALPWKCGLDLRETPPVDTNYVSWSIISHSVFDVVVSSCIILYLTRLTSMSPALSLWAATVCWRRAFMHQRFRALRLWSVWVKLTAASQPQSHEKVVHIADNSPGKIKQKLQLPSSKLLCLHFSFWLPVAIPRKSSF